MSYPHSHPPPYVPYQIDFVSQGTGKLFPATKRRASFKFGFANLQALAEGHTGVDCRGSEHEVALIFSFASGKRQILFDGAEVHYSVEGAREHRVGEGNVFEHAFFMPGNEGSSHEIRITAAGKRFNMLLDGVSYFDFPKMYTLGSDYMKRRYANIIEAAPPPPTTGWGGDIVAGQEGSRKARGGPRVPTTMSTAYHSRRRVGPAGHDLDYTDGGTTAEERRMIAKAKLASLRDLKEKERRREDFRKSRSLPDLARTPEEEIKMVAMAKLQSMRDLKIQKERSEGSAPVPSFARKPPGTGSPKRGARLAPVREESNLIDLASMAESAPFQRPDNVPHTISSVTIDPALADDVPDDVTTNSFMQTYQALDPTRHQQPHGSDASFQFQTSPPVYGDSMRDILPPASSVATSTVPPSFGVSPGLPGAGVAQNAPPPPTLEETNVAFGYAGQYSSPHGGVASPPIPPTGTYANPNSTPVSGVNTNPAPVTYGNPSSQPAPVPKFDYNVWTAAAPTTMPIPTYNGSGFTPSPNAASPSGFASAPMPATSNFNSSPAAPSAPAQYSAPNTTSTLSGMGSPSRGFETPPAGNPAGVQGNGNANSGQASVVFGSSGSRTPEVGPSSAEVAAANERDSVSAALDNLVNLHDINSSPEGTHSPEEEKVKLTMNPPPTDNGQRKNNNGKSSRGLPPSRAGVTWYGPEPTLEEMRNARPPPGNSEPREQQPAFASPPPPSGGQYGPHQGAYGNYQLPPGGVPPPATGQFVYGGAAPQTNTTFTY